MKLIIGLGNPGKIYCLTRHNVGFWVIDTLSERYQIALNTRKFKSLFGEGCLKQEKIIFAKPTTYMNLSGKAVQALAKGLVCNMADLIVVHDDIDLSLGKIRVKTKGRDAGHKGLRSIIQEIGTEQFTRIRIGIGRPGFNEEVVDYVLKPFEEEELPIIKASVEKAADITEQLIFKSE